jgi:hypothetical protein
MYTIEEPYIDTPEAKEGNLPFFQVKNSLGVIVFYSVTRQECENWIQQNS